MSTNAEGQGALILVAEDDPTISQVMEMGLTKLGFRVLLAPDGQAALELAREKKPDLIITDVNMPKMTGFELTRMLKFDKEHRDIPIIMLTARTEDKDQKTGEKVGADIYLMKPFSFEKVVPAIKKLLGVKDD